MSQPAPALDLLIPGLLWVTACSATREVPSTTPVPAALPVVTSTAVDDGFEAPDTVDRRVIWVEGAGTEPHEVALLRLGPGKTMEDFQAWMQDLPGPPPANSVGGVSSLAPKLEAYFEVDLTAQRVETFQLVANPP